MTLKTKLLVIVTRPQVWRLGSMELAVCGLLVYGQQVDTRAAAAAKASAGRLLLTSSAVTVPDSKAAGTYITFDVAGAVNGTFPQSINNAGAIAGFYADNVGSGSHGFLRSGNGTFVTFDVPGAVSGTFPAGVDNDGVITGGYGDNVGTLHGFVRDPNGAISTFDAPGAVNGSAGFAINPAGAIVGAYFDVNFIPHGFLRNHNGSFITFDVPGAVNGTFPSSITPNGVITGTYTDSNFVNFGFLRTASGTFNKIDGPEDLGGQLDPFNLGPTLSINPEGVITGTYFAPISGNPFGGNYRVFVRSAQGAFITFDAANYPPCCIWSAPSGINPAGTITGSFNDGFTINHGFVRASDGNLTTLNALGAGMGFNQGTLPIGITPGGIIAGQFRDAKDVTHGFIFQP
jgi:hypothetical protein